MKKLMYVYLPRYVNIIPIIETSSTQVKMHANCRSKISITSPAALLETVPPDARALSAHTWACATFST